MFVRQVRVVVVGFSTLSSVFYENNLRCTTQTRSQVGRGVSIRCQRAVRISSSSLLEVRRPATTTRSLLLLTTRCQPLLAIASHPHNWKRSEQSDTTGCEKQECQGVGRCQVLFRVGSVLFRVVTRSRGLEGGRLGGSGLPPGRRSIDVIQD